MTAAVNSNELLSTLVETDISGKRIISHAANQSVRPYSTNQEYLYAMREDLADWLKGLYAVEINVVNFFNMLETGTLLCQHANNITTCAEYIRKNNININHKRLTKVPSQFLAYNQGRYVRASSFFARDNIANFIGWCRNELQIPESVMFETNDLVLRHNEKNVILCLLEVARRGSKFGVPAPVLVQMEEDIDNEIELEKVAKERNEPPPRAPVKQKVTCDFKSLDEMVQYILGMCTCPSQFPMVKVSDGKYKVGDSANLIFMRILRQHVMVRVGGGWDTLEHYLNKHDPCRCQRHRTERTLTPRHSRTQSGPSPNLQPKTLNSSGNFGRSSTNKQLVNTARLARSTNNLLDITENNRLDKSPDRRRFSSKSRHSSSDTTSTDERPTPQRYTVASAKSPVKTPATSRRERLSLQPDVFNRLSRPKSTPPIQQKSSVQQDNLLVVQRSKKGSHQIQRSVTPSRLSLSQNNKKRGSSTDRSEIRSKSMVSLNNRLSKPKPGPIPAAGNTRTKQRTSVQPNLNKTHPLKTTPAKDNRLRSRSTGDQLESREVEILHALEKECISNQFSLQHERHTSLDSSIDSFDRSQRQSTDNEDSEVAQHMRGLLEPNTPRHPAGYSSLPRARKDKRESEQRSRIPTPVSFQKQSLSSRSIDINDEKTEKKPSRTGTTERVKIESVKTQSNSKSFMNGHSKPQQQQTADEFENDRQSKASLEAQLNRLLNPNALYSGDDQSRFSQKSRTSEHEMNFDPAPLHASGYSPNNEFLAQKSAFVPIENYERENGLSSAGISGQTLHNARCTAVQTQPQAQNGAIGNPSYNSSPKRYDNNMNEQPSGFHGNMTIRSKTVSRLPSHILQSCGLAGSPCFDSGVESTPNGYPMTPNSGSNTREPQWV
ncbi:uncharacterized protein LOC143462202 [Clavelina lepadiformis]|uniref:uncharacterized protein LOC143462202 n=1 Tax=Clavelina lepadiformis TaxID=159417 RepID=UPI004042EF38